MSRLSITVASWDYDRVRAISDGRVRVEGCDVNYLTMPVEECFERAFFHGEFEVAEIGFSPYLIALSRGEAPYVAVPAFLSRTFRHSAIYVRNDRGIERPQDLRGKRIGVPEYQMSAAMWVRGFLQDDFGIAAAEIEWVQAGLENAGRRDKFPLNLPKGFPLTTGGPGGTLSGMLAEGRLDAVISARPPSCFIAGHPNVRRLFPDYRSAERDYFVRTGLFPIMHAVGIRRDVAQQHPWLPASVYKAFAAGQAHGGRRPGRNDCVEGWASLGGGGASCNAGGHGQGLLAIRSRGQSQDALHDGAIFLRAGADGTLVAGRGNVRREHADRNARLRRRAWQSSSSAAPIVR